MTNPEDVLTRPTCTVPQAAVLLGISKDSAYRAAERGELPVLRVGRRYVVPVPRLRELLGLEPLAAPSRT